MNKQRCEHVVPVEQCSRHSAIFTFPACSLLYSLTKNAVYQHVTFIGKVPRAPFIAFTLNSIHALIRTWSVSLVYAHIFLYRGFTTDGGSTILFKGITLNILVMAVKGDRL